VKNDSGGSLTPPDGWTLRSTRTQGFEINSLYSRELDGSETPGGTITVTSSGTAGRRAAWIIVVDAPGGSGWNFENIDAESSSSTTTINDNDVTTTGNGRLAMNFIDYAQRQTIGQEVLVGASGGTWSSAGYFEGGNTPTLSLQVAELVSAVTIGGGRDTSIDSSGWIVHGLAIWRNSSASTLPDLVVDDIGWNIAQPAVGEALIFNANLHNVGAGPTPAGTTHRVRFEVSSNAVAFETSWTNILDPIAGQGQRLGGRRSGWHVDTHGSRHGCGRGDCRRPQPHLRE
jgi:hypothetical protein